MEMLNTLNLYIASEHNFFFIKYALFIFQYQLNNNKNTYKEKILLIIACFLINRIILIIIIEFTC